MVLKNFDSKELFDIYIKDAEHPFSGWDFSYIANRMVMAPLPWSYDSIVIPYIRKAKSLLDMGTGGGEKLASLQPLPIKTYATEGYEPNFPIAKKRLEPLGVKVVKVGSDDKLDFPDNFFEVIINRHESYSPEEVKRVLHPGGYFITQQVGPTNDVDINRFFGLEISENTIEYLHWGLEFATNQLEEFGFQILMKREDSPIQRCFDIGAIVYYLTAIPWQVPNFSVEKFREKLFALHQKILKDGYFDITSERFIIIARKE
ncbi:MAG: class I SAM-dependent methyltransferase [Asgard group archaeon]|nr:class I SAM-dependent methyltransferase [Asgard group archaeon]